MVLAKQCRGTYGFDSHRCFLSGIIRQITYGHVPRKESEMTKKELMARIYEAQKEIVEAKEVIARSEKTLDTLISELNTKETPKDPSFIVDKDGTKWFLAGQAARALGCSSAVCVYSLC